MTAMHFCIEPDKRKGGENPRPVNLLETPPLWGNLA